MLNKHETPVVPPKSDEPAKPPVMDVRPPEHTASHHGPAAHDAPVAKPSEETEKPVPAESAKKPVSEEPAAKPAIAKAPPTVKAPRQPGVTAAIVATVVIVLGLAALAVYAYLRTNNTSLF